MSARGSVLSAAEVRKPVVAASAVGEFARGGFRGTTIASVAHDAGASDDAVQRFIAYGQLCHLIVTARIEEIPESWALSSRAASVTPNRRGDPR